VRVASLLQAVPPAHANEAKLAYVDAILAGGDFSALMVL